MSGGAARRRERSPAAEWAESRSSMSSSVDLKARTTRSCNNTAQGSPRARTLAADRADAPPRYRPTATFILECGVDVLCYELVVCIQSSGTSVEGTMGRLRRGYDMQLFEPRC